MPTPLRRRLRLARRGLGYTVAISLVLVAVVLGLASQVLPLAERHPARIAAWLSERSGRPVAFDAVETEWTRRGPVLQLDGLRVGEGRDAFVVGDAEMLVSLYAGLLPGHAFSELRLRDLDLTLQRSADGRWSVRGLPGSDRPAGDPLEALEGLGELQVVGGALTVSAPSLGIEARLPKIDLRLQVSGDRVRAGMRAWPARDAAPLDAALDLDRDTGTGRAWGGAPEADLRAWSPLLRAAGVAVDAGRGRAEAWVGLQDYRVLDAQVRVALSDVELHSVDATQGAPVRFSRVDGSARWRVVDAGWQLDVPNLQVDAADGGGTYQRVSLGVGEGVAVEAARIDLAPLAAVAALSGRVPPALGKWLTQARVHGTLADVRLHSDGKGVDIAQGTLAEAGFAPVGDAPGVSGLAGGFEADATGAVLRLRPGADVTVDWPRGFGRAHRARLAGDIAAWRVGQGWRVGTGGLGIDGEDVDLGVRGSLWWQGDGTRPRMDLAARVEPVALPVAKEFWIHHRMPEAVVRWLDQALVDGRLENGRALVSGDLDHWPFREGEGRFEASADIRGGVLKFQPEWPAAQAVDANVTFVADGLQLRGTGALAGIEIDALQADIDHYQGGTLTVGAQADADAAGLLALLRDSPLREAHGETLASLQAAGPADVTFGLALPLRKAQATRIDGHVDLQGVRLSDPRWDLAFTQVRGRADYANDGFRAEGLQAVLDGRPSRLSLRAGGGVDSPGHVFEAALAAELGAEALVARVPQLDWLQPHMIGRSDWTADLAVAKRGGTRLQLASNLVGTALTLPAPLDKLAGTALPTRVTMPLPVESGDVEVSMGNLAAVRVRRQGERTGVRVELGAQRAPAAPAHGLIAAGQADRLDAIGWIALARAGTGSAASSGGDTGPGLPLRSVDIRSRRLELLGGVFPSTRVQVDPAAAGALAVRVQGPALQGRLTVPDGDRPVTGDFQRVHWRSAKAGAASATAAGADDTPPLATASGATPSPAAAPVADDSDIDPARIPAMALEIDDFRVADAALGALSFRSRPTPAGLRVERLQARARDQAIDVTGSWTGRGTASRTHLVAGVDSDDIGSLMQGLGLGGRIAGGDGNLHLDVRWPGSPAAFSLASLDGALTLDARDGRLLEVEPGAGRVLGLLSIAELPRRLTLDFRDFFSKGFAFNRIDGSVRFADGQARSEGLTIDGPAAAIDIRGQADLRRERFDQTIEVRPKAGNLLTAVGAIAGGPVGAAIGAAANAVLSRPLGELAARTYRVTGPWSDPDVEVIDERPARPVASEPPPAG